MPFDTLRLIAGWRLFRKVCEGDTHLHSSIGRITPAGCSLLILGSFLKCHHLIFQTARGVRNWYYYPAPPPFFFFSKQAQRIPQGQNARLGCPEPKPLSTRLTLSECQKKCAPELGFSNLKIPRGCKMHIVIHRACSGAEILFDTLGIPAKAAGLQQGESELICGTRVSP